MHGTQIPEAVADDSIHIGGFSEEMETALPLASSTLVAAEKLLPPRTQDPAASFSAFAARAVDAGHQVTGVHLALSRPAIPPARGIEAHSQDSPRRQITLFWTSQTCRPIALVNYHLDTQWLTRSELS
jgi:hypothetical protein